MSHAPAASLALGLALFWGSLLLYALRLRAVRARARTSGEELKER